MIQISKCVARVAALVLTTVLAACASHPTGSDADHDAAVASRRAAQKAAMNKAASPTPIDPWATLHHEQMATDTAIRQLATSTEKGFKGIGKAMEANTEVLKKLSAGLDATDKNVTAMGARLDGRLDNTDKAVATLGARLGALESHVAVVGAGVTDLKNQQDPVWLVQQEADAAKVVADRLAAEAKADAVACSGNNRKIIVMVLGGGHLAFDASKAVMTCDSNGVITETWPFAYGNVVGEVKFDAEFRKMAATWHRAFKNAADKAKFDEAMKLGEAGLGKVTYDAFRDAYWCGAADAEIGAGETLEGVLGAKIVGPIRADANKTH